MKIILEKNGQFHTYVKDWISYIAEPLDKFNFIINDIEVNGGGDILYKYESSLEGIAYLIPGEELILISEIQFIWGTFSAIDKNIDLQEIDLNKSCQYDDPAILFDYDKEIYRIEYSTFEVIAFDSSATIIQSKDKTSLQNINAK